MEREYTFWGKKLIVRTTSSHFYNGLYMPQEDHSVILIKDRLTINELQTTLTHELTHMCYNYNFDSLDKVIEEHDPNKTLGNYTSEALATFMGKYGREIIINADLVFQDMYKVFKKTN